MRCYSTSVWLQFKNLVSVNYKDSRRLIILEKIENSPKPALESSEKSSDSILNTAHVLFGKWYRLQYRLLNFREGLLNLFKEEEVIANKQNTLPDFCSGQKFRDTGTSLKKSEWVVLPTYLPNI